MATSLRFMDLELGRIDALRSWRYRWSVYHDSKTGAYSVLANGDYGAETMGVGFRLDDKSRYKPESMKY